MNSDLTGHLLVAVPEMDDPNFSRTVVLLVRHSPEEGAMGVILNRPLNLSMQEVWQNVSTKPLETQQPANWGGPVQSPLVVLHRQMSYADLTVIPDLYVTTKREHVESLIQQSLTPFRFYLGYSGWGQGQLEQESEDGGWFILPPDSEIVFADPYEMWKHCCSQVGNQVLHRDSRLRRFSGRDPDLN